MKYRRCSKCKFVLELDDFYYAAKDKDKRQWYCKICDIDYHREREINMKLLLKYDQLYLGIEHPVRPKRAYRTTTPSQVSIRS